DDALRAVRLGLEVVRRVPAELADVEVRVALHAGPVLLLVEGEREMLVLGVTLERAQALLAPSEDDAPSILASREVERLTRHAYDWVPMAAAGDAHPSADRDARFRLPPG
ncbi:MAG: hypothetical protein AAFY88_13150, partial [Acidobacteriota bacterium]